MKITTFISSLLALVLVSACARDTEVVGPNERGYSNNGNNQKANGGTAIKAKIPEKLELAMSVIAEGRYAQSQAILAKAIALAEPTPSLASTTALAEERRDDKKKDKPCVVSDLLGKTENSETYRLSYALCQSKNDGFEGNLSGEAELIIETNSEDGKKKLVSFEYNSAPVDSSSANALTMSLFKKNAKDTLMIQESFQLKAHRIEASSVFEIETATASSALRLGYQETATATALSTNLSGELAIDGNAKWGATVRGIAQSLRDSSAPPAAFALVMTPQKEGTLDFVMNFGKIKRAGTVQIADDKLTVLSADGDPRKAEKKVETLTQPRKKASSIESLLTWDNWF